jgi:hypothetical protein
MPKVTLTFEDQPGGVIKTIVNFDPPIDKNTTSRAQIKMANLLIAMDQAAKKLNTTDADFDKK